MIPVIFQMSIRKSCFVKYISSRGTLWQCGGFEKDLVPRLPIENSRMYCKSATQFPDDKCSKAAFLHLLKAMPMRCGRNMTIQWECCIIV